VIHRRDAEYTEYVTGRLSSLQRLAAGDLDFFARALPQTEHWRLLPQVLEDAAFLDLEAAGERELEAGRRAGLR